MDGVDAGCSELNTSLFAVHSLRIALESIWNEMNDWMDKMRHFLEILRKNTETRLFGIFFLLMPLNLECETERV